MVPNKINKEKLKFKKTHHTNITPVILNTSRNDKPNKKDNQLEKLKKFNIEENENVTNSEEEEKSKLMIGGCCVCADDTGYSNNLLVYCDGCDIAVHQGCYGIINVPEGDWFCRRCEYLKKNSDSKLEINCQLCPMKDGAIKRTDNNKWAHVLCALFIPEISFGSNRTMEPIILKDIHADRLNKKCSICEIYDPEKKRDSISDDNLSDPLKLSIQALPLEPKNGFAYVNCNKQGCKQWFHVTCAQIEGLLCEDHRVSQNNVTYCIYCKAHFEKLTNSTYNIKRLPAFKINKQVSEVKTDSSLNFTQQTKSAKLPKRKNSKEPIEKLKKMRANVNNSIDNKQESNILMSISPKIESKKLKNFRISKSNILVNDANVNTNNITDICKNDETKKEQLLNISTIGTDIEKTEKDENLFVDNDNDFQPLLSLKLEKTTDQLMSNIMNNNENGLVYSIQKNRDDDKYDSNKLIINSKADGVSKNLLIEIDKERDFNEKKSDSVFIENNDSLNKDKVSNRNDLNRTNLKFGLNDENKTNKRKGTEYDDKPITNQPDTPTSSQSSPSSFFYSNKLQSNKYEFLNNTVISTHNNENLNMPLIQNKEHIRMEKNEESIEDEIPNSLEDLLTKQWSLGANLIFEQLENFDVLMLLNSLNECKKENENLEKQLTDLEKNRLNLIQINEKLQNSLNGQMITSPSQEKDNVHFISTGSIKQQLENQSFKPIEVSKKQTASSVFIPENSDLNFSKSSYQNIPLSISPSNIEKQNYNLSQIIKKNNNLYLNNINPIQQTENFFNNPGELKELKEINTDWENFKKSNEISSMNRINNSLKSESEFDINYGNCLNQNQSKSHQHIRSFFDISKINSQKKTISKTDENNIYNKSDFHPLIQMNHFQQQLYYAYLIQQQVQKTNSSVENLPDSTLLVHNNLNMVNSNTHAANNNASKAILNLSKPIFDLAISQVIPNN